MTPLFISAIGALATAIGFLFKTMMDIIRRSENRSQGEIERSKEEINRVIDMCEQRLDSEKETRNIVMGHMEAFGVTLENINQALTNGLGDVNKRIDVLSEKVDRDKRC